MFTIFSGFTSLSVTLFQSEQSRGWMQQELEDGVGEDRKKTNPSKLDLAFRMYNSKEYRIQEILDASGVSRATFYRYLSKR